MPAPKKNPVGKIIKKVVEKSVKKAPAKKTGSSKAEEYSDLFGTKKKGYKIKMEPNKDALPTSNVKVKGRPNSSIEQRTRKGLPSRTTPAKTVPVKGKRGTAKTWGRRDSLN